MTPHDVTPMGRCNVTHYSGKSYSDAFVCPICGNRKRANLNFLGAGRSLWCDGTKTIKLELRGPTVWAPKEQR